MPNADLSNARRTRNDEFYTQYKDIEKEIGAYLESNPKVFKGKTILLPCDDPEWSNFTKYFAQNFETLGLRKLISTSYAPDSNPAKLDTQPTLFEMESPEFDQSKTRINGKIFTLYRDKTGNSRMDYEDLEWKYLEGDGDFRSDEIKRLRDESDVIITNPPFSLFRDFLAWVFEAKKQLVIIGNMNAVTYKEVFPLLKEDKLWFGNGFQSGNAFFAAPVEREYASGVFDAATGLVKFRNVVWFTNLDHGRRHEPLPLMTMADNLKFSKHKQVREFGYPKYDNYDAIEVPFTDAIPSDYEGIMGVPISFLHKYSPEQFEILGETQRGCHDAVPDTKKYDTYWEVKPDGTATGSSGGKTNENANLVGNDGKRNYFINKEGDIVQSSYQRLFIRHRKRPE